MSHSPAGDRFSGMTALVPLPRGLGRDLPDQCEARLGRYTSRSGASASARNASMAVPNRRRSENESDRWLCTRATTCFSVSLASSVIHSARMTVASSSDCPPLRSWGSSLSSSETTSRSRITATCWAASRFRERGTGLFLGYPSSRSFGVLALHRSRVQLRLHLDSLLEPQASALTGLRVCVVEPLVLLVHGSEPRVVRQVPLRVLVCVCHPAQSGGRDSPPARFPQLEETQTAQPSAAARRAGRVAPAAAW